MVGTAGDPLDPRLGPLQDNGGFTETHALLEDSPAINVIRAKDCVFDDDGDVLTKNKKLKTDQRLKPRKVGGGCDIGAYEAPGNLGKGNGL